MLLVSDVQDEQTALLRARMAKAGTQALPSFDDVRLGRAEALAVRVASKLARMLRERTGR